jgi:hypothetical protein
VLNAELPTPIPVVLARNGIMRKVIELLDDEQRAALHEWANLGIAISTSALVVTFLRNIVGLFD